jgi:acetylornithine/N-succinyldiaminopimelate aminotransferase
MTDNKTSDLAEPHVMHTYGRLPIALSHGKGVWVWDTTGKKYIDGLSGIAVSTLGHEHPKLVAALHDQVSKIIHTSNYYASPLQERVAAKLCELSGLSKAFFCNSGLEANEAAIKIARKFGHGKGIEKPEIIVYEKAFHGRSIATLAATGNVKVQVGFGPLPEGFPRVPVNDFEAVKAVIESNPSVCAVFLEVIQGEGGVNATTIDYLKKLRALCDERDVLLMLDEVQCGLGRTGKWFAHQWAGIKPDVMPLAKGLASGVPVGAVVVGEKLKDIFSPGNHGTTFGGNPLAMRAAITTLETIEQDKLLENAAAVGQHFRDIFKREFEGLPGVLELRGEGLMIGIALDRPCGELLGKAAEAGVLLSVTADTVVRLLPALIMTKEEATHITDIIVPMIKDFLAKKPA